MTIPTLRDDSYPLSPEQGLAVCEQLLKAVTDEGNPDETDKIFSIEQNDGQSATIIFTRETWVDNENGTEHKGMLVTRIIQEVTGAITIAQLAYKPSNNEENGFEIINGTNGEKLLEMFADPSLVGTLVDQLGKQQDPTEQEQLKGDAVIDLRKEVIKMFCDENVIGFDFSESARLTFLGQINKPAIILNKYKRIDYYDEEGKLIPLDLILKALAEAYFVYSTDVLGDSAYEARREGTDVEVMKRYMSNVPSETSLLEAKPIIAKTLKALLNKFLGENPNEIKLAQTNIFRLPLFGITITLKEQGEKSTLAINATAQNPHKLIIKAKDPMQLLELVQKSQDPRLKSPIFGEIPLFFDNPKLFRRLSQIKDLVRLLDFNPIAADVRFDSPISFGYKIEPEDTLSAGVSVEMDLKQGNLADRIAKLPLQERAAIYELLAELYPQIKEHTAINLIKTPIIHPVGINLDGPIKRTSPLQLQQTIDTGEIIIKGDGASIRIAKNGEITTIYSPQRQQGKLVGNLNIRVSL